MSTKYLDILHEEIFALLLSPFVWDQLLGTYARWTVILQC